MKKPFNIKTPSEMLEEIDEILNSAREAYDDDLPSKIRAADVALAAALMQRFTLFQQLIKDHPTAGGCYDGLGDR